MKVTLVANTAINDDVLLELTGGNWEPAAFDTDADALAEFGGRACYQSWARPNPATATNEGYLGNVIDHGHFSVLEHGVVSFYIEGISRSLTHELVRHRHLSPSQLSQRFVDETSAVWVAPPASREYEEDMVLLADLWADVMDVYVELVQRHVDRGLNRKQAREAARAVLPNMTETKILLTGNHRSWREFVTKRNSVHADAEIRELAAEILRQLRTIAPNTYQDIDQEPAA